MTDRNEALIAHFARYPLMMPRDAVKLLYQSVFGSGHLIADPAQAAQRLSQERATCALLDTPAFEPIGGGFCRMHLGARALEGIPDAALCALFLRAAQIQGSREEFQSALADLQQLTARNVAPFSPQALRDYLRDYCTAGFGPVSHSEPYRLAYRPAYRVVLEADAASL